MIRIAKIIASLFCIGYLRPFPATWGSAVIGTVLYFFWPGLDVTVKLAITIAVFLLGTYFAGLIERIEKIHDPSFVIIDEAVGMMIATFLLPKVWWQLVLAFFLFRIFDVLKPWPASWLNKLKGGFALMGDDVIAGIYTIILMVIIF